LFGLAVRLAALQHEHQEEDVEDAAVAALGDINRGTAFAVAMAGHTSRNTMHGVKTRRRRGGRSKMSEVFDAKAYVMGMERLGYMVRAIGDRWYWGRLEGVSPSSQLLELQNAVNASEGNSVQVLSFLVETGRVDRRQ
jgi:hypothetical protein